MATRIRWLGLFVLLVAPAVGRAGEDYFVLMFGQQQIPNDPNYSHTFATFVKATWAGDGPCPVNAKLEAHTISWLPENGVVRCWALLPECGRNFGLHETIRWAECNHMRTSVWGAYRICPELYCMALKQEGLLESGQVRYKAVDSLYPSERVSNCIHAVSGVRDGNRVRIGAPCWGETASYMVLRRFERYIVSREPAPWVGSALGLDAFALIYRDWEFPLSGPLGPVFRTLGVERELSPSFGPPMR